MNEVNHEIGRLREALQWAIDFIRGNVPGYGYYPDYHNATALVQRVPLSGGPFHEASARAELAELDVRQLCGEVTILRQLVADAMALIRDARWFDRARGVLSGQSDTLELRSGARRSSAWPGVRTRHLLREPVCQACAGKEYLEVHHILPVHVAPQLELDEANLITLCDKPGRNCHHVWGHLLDYQRRWNPTVRQDAAAYLARVQNHA